MKKIVITLLPLLWTSLYSMHMPQKLTFAVQQGLLETVEALLKKDKSFINEPGIESEPALHWAAITANPSMVSLLLDHGAGSTLLDNDLDTPLHSAAIGGNLEVVRILLTRGAADSVNMIDVHGYAPLHSAAFHGHDDIVKELLQQPTLTCINHISRAHLTPLDAALENGHLNTAQILKDHGARTYKEILVSKTAS